jgi:DNA-binding MarR family transcriptional regulator
VAKTHSRSSQIEAGSKAYFQAIAEARYVIRRVFRLVDERAKLVDLEPLEHQALIQIHGAHSATMNVGEVAERLHVSPAFSSKLVKSLVAKGFVQTKSDASDQRVVNLSATRKGAQTLVEVDDDVRMHVDYFTQQLSAEQKEAALAVFAFYVGVNIRVLHHHSSMDEAMLPTLITA